MGILDLLISDVEPALEADDITERVAQQMRGDGGPNEVDNATGADREQEEDLTQTDNIYEEATDPNDGKKDDDRPAGQDAPPDGGDDQGDQSEEGENPLERNDDPGADDGGDTNSDDTSGSDDTSSEETNPPSSVFSDKNTLKTNAISLINILTTNIESLSASLGNLDDISDIKCCNSVIANLTRTKEILFRMVTTEMKTKSYEELVTVYVTAKRIYDVSIEMLDKHFIKDRKGKSPLNSRRSEKPVR